MRKLRVFLLVLSLTLEQSSSQQQQASDGICRDIEEPPAGLFPLRKETGGENIYGDSNTEAEIVGVKYADDIDGKIEYAAQFDGSRSSYIEIPRNAKLDSAKDISIVMNIFPEGEEGELLTYKITGGGVQISQRKGTKEGHSILAVRFVKRTLLLVDDLTAECLVHGTWNHIAATYNYETGDACLYKDGELLKKLNVGSNYIATQFAIRIGALENSAAPFKGRISCLQIYRHTLDLENVKQSQYVCRKTSIVIPESKVSIKKSEFPEPGNDITFLIDQPNTDIHIIIDFGDGSPKYRTRDRQVTHQYETHGPFKPKVSICLGCPSNNMQFDDFVRVFSYVEKPYNLQVTVPDPSLYRNVTAITARLGKGSFFNCTWSAGDNSEDVLTVYDGTFQQSIFHTYPNPGIFTGSVTCSNRKATLTKSFQVDNQEPITGLEIDKIPPQSITKGFKASWKVSGGHPVHYKVTVNGKEQSFLQNEKQAEAIIEASMFDGQHGVYKIIVQTENKVTKTITEEKSIQVFPVIRPVSVAVAKHTIEVNETLGFIADSENPRFEGYPIYEWDFGDGRKSSSKDSNHTSHKYAIYGKTTVKLTTSNPVESQISLIEIDILRPVLHLEGLNCTIPPTFTKEKASLQCDLKIGSDFTCSVDWDGEGTTNHDFTDQKYYIDQSVSKTQFQDLHFEDVFYFEKPKHYVIGISCNNRLSKSNFQTKVVVQDKVRGVNIDPVDPQVFGDSFRIQWKAISGSEVLYKFYWNVVELTNMELLDGKPSAEITEAIYKTAGIHEFKVVAWNAVSEPKEQTILIIIEDSISEVDFTLKSKHSYLEVHENITLDFVARAGSNPHYQILSSESDVTTKSNRHVMSFSTYGDFEVKVRAFNNISEIIKTKNIKVLKPVVQLGELNIKVPNENVSESVDVSVALTQGSDYTCYIDFGDKTVHNSSVMYDQYYTSEEEKSMAKYENIQMKFSHAYSEIRTYQIKITCANRLNKVSSTAQAAIFKPLVPFSILVPETNEQNSLIKIEISSENDIAMSKHQFHVQFGDNTENTTTSNRIDHSYKFYGQYIITVTAESPVSKITVQQEIIILKPVIVLKNIQVSSAPVNLTEPTVLSFKLEEGSDFKCNIKWLSDHETTIDKSKDLVYYDSSDMDEFKDISFQTNYIFKDEGHHKIEVTCSNRLGSVSTDITVITQVALKGFYLKPTPPREFGKDFYIQYDVQRGSELDISCLFNGKQVNVIKEEKRILITANLVETPGVYSFKLTGSNLVSASITREGTVVIDEKIKDVSVTISKEQIEVNETVTFNVEAIAGSAVLFSIDYSDSHSEKNVISNKYTHDYKVQGDYNVLVTAYNNISKVQASVKVTVLKPVLPVVGLTINMLEHLNISSPYAIKLFLEQGSDFECTIDYGNDIVDSISKQNSDYYTKEPRWSASKFQKLSIIQNKVFSKVGACDIKAVCKNRLHKVEATRTIHIHSPLSAFSIQADKQEVEINETIKFEIVDVDPITDPIFITEGGKYTHKETTRKFTFQKSFTHHGKFTVKVNASNPTSSVKESIDVVVLKPVLKLEDLSVTTTPTNLTNDLNFKVSLGKGSDYKCQIAWGDKTEQEEKNFQSEYSFYTDLSLDEKPFTDIKMEFAHSYKEIGIYTIKIKCGNRKNEIAAEAIVDIQVPISGFKLVDVNAQRFGATFELKWLTSKGSNIEYEIRWDNNLLEYQLAGDKEVFATIEPKNYAKPGIYKYTVTAKNKVSDAGLLSGYVIIENQLKGLDIILSKSLEIEVNETIKVKVALESGNNPHFKYDAGDGQDSVETMNLEVPFSYIKQGSYKLKVMAWNNVSRIEGEATLTVIKPVLALSKINIRTSIAYDTKKTTEIKVIVASGSDYKCSILYGDGDQEITETVNGHYYLNGRMEKMTDFDNTELSYQHNYTTGDTYSLQVTCTNRISSQSARTKVFVQDLITNLLIFPVSPKKVGEEFTIKFHASLGSNITYFVHFQDKVTHHHSDNTDMIEHQTSSNRPGVFQVLINATNHITGIIVKRINIIIEEPIKELEIFAPASSVKLEVGEAFEFCYGIKQGSNPHFKSYFDGKKIDLEEKTTKLKMEDDDTIQFCFKHEFDLHKNFTSGIFDLKLDLQIIAQNNVSNVESNVEIRLLKPVLNVEIESLACQPAVTNMPSQLSLVVSGSDLKCVWRMENKKDFETKLSDVYHLNGIADQSKFTSLEKSHEGIYDSFGVYKTEVECGNRKDSVTSSVMCYVQDSISGVKVDPIGSKTFGKSHNISWVTQQGTNITYQVKINNVEINNIHNKNEKNIVSLEGNMFDSPGDYVGEIIASNLVTKNLITKFMIRLERDLKIVDVSITYENGKTGNDQEGHGDGSYFPVRKDTNFKITTNAQVYDVDWTINFNGTKEISNQQKSFDHNFEEAGTRVIQYRVHNNVSSAEGNVTVTFIESVGFIIISSTSPKAVGSPINFTIFMPEKGQETCFKFETGDGVVLYYTTEKGNCREFYPNVTSVNGIFPKHKDSLLVSHHYNHTEKWKYYTAKVSAINHLSRKNSSTIVLVSKVKCNFPNVNITNLGISPFYPTRLAKSEKMTVYVDTVFDCEYISKAKYEWKIYRYNPVNGRLAEVKFDNKTDYGFDPFIQKDLIIKKKVLNYGIYLIKVTVTMNDPKTMIFKMAARGYLQVYPSTLVASIYGGALIRRGIGKDIPISGRASCDPDINKNNFTGMNFTWYCFNAMEEVPDKFKESYGQIPNYKVAVLEPQAFNPSIIKNGGCYGNGTYFFNTTDENFKLDSAKMLAEQAYVIFLILRKGERRSLGYQVLELVNGLPPELGIECAENCLEKINPSGKFALMGKCIGDACSHPDMRYEWEVYTVKKITDDGKIIWELDVAVMEAVAQYTKDVVFVIKKFTLTPSKLYRFTLKGGIIGGAKGLAQRNGFTNTPPNGGNCFPDTYVGEAMQTTFTFTCENWEDEDLPLRYEFVYYNEIGAESLFLFGASNIASGKLPMGAEKDNFTIRFDVRIIDVYEATSVVSFNVSVVEPKLSEEEMIGKLLNMTQGENSELEIIVNSGDTQAIAKLMNSVVSILNKNSDKAGKRKKERSHSLAHLSVNGTLQVNGSVIFHNGTVLHNNKTAVLSNGTIIQKNGTVLHPNGTTYHNGTWLFGNHTGLNITELTAEQQLQQDRETIRAAMIKALSNQQSTSLEAMRQNADVMSSLTKSKDEVNAEAQEASASSMLGMTSQLSGESSGEDGAGSDAVEGVAGTMTSGLGNLLGSAAGSAKAKVVPKATTTTAPTTTISILGFEMMFDMDEEDFQVSDEDDDYVETDPTKLKAQSTVAGVFSAAGSVGGSMTGKKLPGEESTVIDSPSMAMASGQVDPEKMGAPVCSPSGAGFKMPTNGNLLKNAGNTSKVPALGQQMMAMKDNPFTWDPKGGVSGTVTSVTLSAGGGGGLNVNGTDEPIEITMPREGENDPPSLVSFPPYTQKYVYHKVEIEKNNTAFTAHIIPQNFSEAPFNGTAMLGVYVRRQLKPTKQKHDWSFIFPKESNETFDACNPAPPEANYTLFISDKYLHKGVYWIGVSYLAPPGMPEEALVNSTLNYTLRIFTSQCKYWSDATNKWSTDGCHVGPKTDLSKTHCLCTHLTSFGGGMITAPAPIDFSKVFAGFADMFASGNVSVFFTIVGMFGVYILLAVYSRRMDKKEEAQMGVTPIFNIHDPDANYQYEITFYTNRGSNSGTSAQVFINIVGSKGESGPLPLKDAERQVFIPGAVNSFLVMVPSDLGKIEHVRLWHDNSGYSPAWNLQKMTMRDLQSNESWIFLGGWWAIDEGEFQIDKQVKPATEADLADFKVLFQEKLMRDLGDAHIWFSIFMRPPTSRFTRLQRLSSCLTILCLTMVSSAMFFGAGPASAEDDANAIAVGPVRVSLKMVIIGIQSTLVVMPPTVTIVYLFASAKRRHAITIESSLKKAVAKREREENGDSEEEETSTICCCFKRKRKQKSRKSKSCFRCCRRKSADGFDTESESEEFDSITGEDNEAYENDRGETPLSRRRTPKPKIRGYYSSSDDGASSDETYVSSSDEVDTSPETDDDPIFDETDIAAIEEESSQILIEDEDEKPNQDGCLMKLYKRFTKKKDLTEEEEKKKQLKEVQDLEKQLHGSLPWWVIYPAWVLVFFGSTTPALFTLFYSMMWGKVKSNEWLTTQALSFFQDTFVSRPIKIIIITTLVAIIMKNKPKGDEDSMPGEPLQEDETMITSGLEDRPKSEIEEMCKPPSAKQVALLRQIKLKEKKMGEILRELAFFMFYIMLLFLVSGSNRDIWAYRQRNVIDRMVVNGGSKNNPMMAINSVNDVATFWKYVNQTFIPTMYYESWYNGDVYNYTAYALLRDTKRLGITRLRQIRTKNDTCIIHDEFKKYIQECNDKYSATAEDTKWYKRGWTNPIKKGGKQKKRFSPWKYANGFESRNIVPVMATLNTYMGGGYLGELGINEKFSLMYEQYMKKYNWVDKHTRAVFLEFTLYNPNLNLISVGELMFEFFNFGGVIPRAEIYVSRMYRNLVPEHKIFLGFDIVFFIYTLYCLFRECRKMKRTKSQYFKSLNNITNFVLTFFGLGVMGIYAIRSLSLGSKIAEFLESPHLFISFYQNAMYHEMVAMLMSLIDFIAIIKFLTFLQFNRNFLTLIQTVVRAAPKLAIFCSYISLWVMAFVVFSFLLFGAERFNFHSLQRSIYSLNLLLLGVFDWNDFISRPYIGPILFVVYCIIMTFMLMNIFMTILMEFYAVVQADEELKKREFHLVQYLMESFMLSMGLKKPLGLGEDEVKWRKKDPFIHRINRLQRSIEEKKTAKMNKMINKLYADDIIEDVEMVSLELMRYPDEFFDLIPCSVKLKLQAMLRRGEIDYETYCEFLEISMAQEESASIRSRGSLASQKTLNLVPDIEDQDSFTADIVTNERFAEPDPDLQAELEYLKQYQNEQFTPRGTATISDLNLQIHEGYINEEDQETEDSIQKQQQHQVEQASQQLQDLQDIGNSLADFNDNSSKNDSNAHSILANKQHNDAIGEEPTHNDDNNVRDSAANSDYKHMTQSRDRPHTDTVDTRPSPTTNPQRFSPQTSINIDLNASNVSSITLQDSQNLDSTRNLLGESANGGNLVVASRRKNKKKRKTTSNA